MGQSHADVYDLRCPNQLLSIHNSREDSPQRPQHTSFADVSLSNNASMCFTLIIYNLSFRICTKALGDGTWSGVDSEEPPLMCRLPGEHHSYSPMVESDGHDWWI
jgi:hypothetical protein